MLDVTNIHALSSFTRNARRHVKRLRASGEPEMLTINVLWMHRNDFVKRVHS